MNIKKILVISIILLITGGCSFSDFFPTAKEETINNVTPTNFAVDGRVFSSRDNNFEFHYPDDFTIVDTSQIKAESKYGNVLQSWILFNRRNNINIYFEMTDNNDNLKLVDLIKCSEGLIGARLVRCGQIDLNGDQYNRVVADLDSGDYNVVYQTTYPNTFVSVSVLIKGEKQEDNLALVEKIASTFKINKE